MIRLHTTVYGHVELIVYHMQLNGQCHTSKVTGSIYLFIPGNCNKVANGQTRKLKTLRVCYSLLTTIIAL